MKARNGAFVFSKVKDETELSIYEGKRKVWFLG